MVAARMLASPVSDSDRSRQIEAWLAGAEEPESRSPRSPAAVRGRGD